MLADLYHLATNGDDLDRVIATYADSIAHVQVADAPGRGEPGSGDLDLDRCLQLLEDRGYDGWVALEYKPTTSTLASLQWLPRERRGTAAAPR
jgi:hydroxypyruvate isomerase